MVYPHSGVLLSLKREAVLLSVTGWMNLEGIMLNEISQPQKGEYCRMGSTMSLSYKNEIIASAAT